jgi:flavin-dependent dehydrogenase
VRIAILGGGPGGLLAALLAKRGDPAREVTVFERNRAGDTFGFGVVFSDATLDGPSPRWASWTRRRSATCSPGGAHHDRL